MHSIMEKLSRQHNVLPEEKEILKRIERCTELLKKDFSKWQKKQLLRIIDDKDLLAAEQVSASFTNGVRYGVLFMIEIFSEEKESDS